jgi:2',3'-cyclic-nucleotide 2'-phosphodiesterase (5'-nucleotidase family)
MLKHIAVLIIGAGLTACSSFNILSVKSDYIPVTDEFQKVSLVDSIVYPYRIRLEEEMLEVIAIAENNFTKSRPNGSLNNWTSDAILNSVDKRIFELAPYFCLLNIGGLRSPLNKGEILLQDIYKLMPFDNEIVIVELPFSSLDKIAKYIQNSGGEPISNAYLNDGLLHFTDPAARWMSLREPNFYVVTSDYLMSGGDNMEFFQDQLRVIYTNVLMRDAMIEQVKKQGTLIFNNEKRIHIK